MLWILDANTLADKKPPVLIAGNADNGGGGIANGFTTPYQKMRAGLGLLTDAAGNKAVVISFSINGENPRGPGHGFVVAFDVRGLNRQPGFTPTPAIWNVTPGGGAGGIWMSGSGPAIDGDHIYLATGNGMDPGTIPGNFAESFVKLRYTAGVAGVNNGKPKLAVADYWAAFSDFGRADEDQDLGAAGVFLIPERGNLIGGGKDGIIYNLNKDNLGKNTLESPLQSALRRDLSAQRAERPGGARRRRPRPIRTGRSSIAIATSPAQTPTGKSHHIHGTPVYMEHATGGILYVWGENERLKAYNYDFATKRITGFRAPRTQRGLGQHAAPGGMPGGRLVVSSNGAAPGTGVVWGAYPTQGDANSRGRSRRARRVRRDRGHQRRRAASSCFTATRTLPTTWGTLPSTPRRWWRTGKSTSGRSATRSSSSDCRSLSPVPHRPSPPRRRSSAPSPPGAGGPGCAHRTCGSLRAPQLRSDGLRDLDAMTFSCPKAGLNAAAREAAKVPSRGTYQFSYFEIISDSHHASYEVHFKSNYEGEPDLEYCVSIYCQQGWDPKTTQGLR